MRKKPLYQLATLASTGIDKIPLNRMVYLQEKNAELVRVDGDPANPVTNQTTVSQAITYGHLSPIGIYNKDFDSNTSEAWWDISHYALQDLSNIINVQGLKLEDRDIPGDVYEIFIASGELFVDKIYQLEAPGTITDFAASDNLNESIKFTWTNTTGYPFPTYDLYKVGDTIPSVVGIVSGDEYAFSGTDNFYVKAINTEGTQNSNTNQGTALAAITISMKLYMDATDQNPSFTATGGNINMTQDSTDGTIWYATSVDTITGFHLTDTATNSHIVGIDFLKATTLTDMSLMLYLASSANKIATVNFDMLWDTSNIVQMHNVFKEMPLLITADLSTFDITNVETMQLMFNTCSSLIDVLLPITAAPNLTDVIGLFYHCDALSNVNFNDFDVSNVTNATQMVSECNSLINVDISMMPFTAQAILSGLFIGCSNLINAKLPEVAFEHVPYLFQDCVSLKCINYINTTASIDHTDLFTNCPSLIYPNSADQSSIESTAGDVWSNEIVCDPIFRDASTDNFYVGLNGNNYEAILTWDGNILLDRDVAYYTDDIVTGDDRYRYIVGGLTDGFGPPPGGTQYKVARYSTVLIDGRSFSTSQDAWLVSRNSSDDATATIEVIANGVTVYSNNTQDAANATIRSVKGSDGVWYVRGDNVNATGFDRWYKIIQD